MSRWTYTSGMKGYTIYEDGEFRGGAMVLNRPRHWRHQRANVKMFRELAQTECARREEAGRCRAR